MTQLMAIPEQAATAEPLAIGVRGLTMSYGSRQVLRGVDFEVRSGEVFCRLGPNGAGNTTTVEILEGFRQRVQTAGVPSTISFTAPVRLRSGDVAAPGCLEVEVRGDVASCRVPSASLTRQVRLAVRQALHEQRSFWRSAEYALFTFALPLALLLIGSTTAGGTCPAPTSRRR
jgi:ABC-type phosphate transport system ATPase subunit